MSTTLRVKVGERWFTVEVEDPHARPVKAMVDGDEVEVHIDRPAEDFPSDPPPREVAEAPHTAAVAPAAARSFNTPMPGVIMSIAVKVGDQVVTGDEICVLEAMKMQQTLRADWSGIISAVHVVTGQQVLDGDPIVDLE